MYLGYREWNSDLEKDVFVVCLEGTKADIRRVKHTSTYFSQDRFETINYSKIKKDRLTLVDKSGRIIDSSFIPEDMKQLSQNESSIPLEELKKFDSFSFCIDDTVKFAIVENTINKLAELENVLKIIREKEIDLYLFKISINCNHYNWLAENRKQYLTKEEYNLLKKYFK